MRKAIACSISLILFVCLVVVAAPINTNANLITYTPDTVSYTKFDLSPYGSYSRPLVDFSGYATVQNEAIIDVTIDQFNDDFYVSFVQHTWPIQYFRMEFETGLTHSGSSGFIRLNDDYVYDPVYGSVPDYSSFDTWEMGGYWPGDYGFGVVLLDPHDLLYNPMYRLPTTPGLDYPTIVFALNLPEPKYDNSLLPPIRPIAFTNPVATEPVPEPTTMILFGTGLIVLIGFGRKKFKKS